MTGDHKGVVSRCSLKCRAILVGACHGVSARQFSSTGSVAVHEVVWLDKLAILQCCGVSSHSAFAIFSDVWEPRSLNRDKSLSARDGFSS